ncbi:MAG: tetratricopeptide repeat protein [Bryobacterales bacterium]|nr:tetratricopeptide repeat protein [Bryobacterales bacterium]
MWLLLLTLLAQSANPVEDGNQALDAKQYERALSLFTQAAAADPKDYAAQFQLALTYSLLDRHAEAIPHYAASLALHPGFYEAELNLGLSLLRTNNPAGAISHFRAAAAQNPKEMPAAVNLAQVLLDTGHFAEAEVAFTNVLALDPRAANAESGLALSLARQKRLDEAAPHFKQAAALDARYRPGLLELGQLYEAGGRTAEAAALYRQFPDDAAAAERNAVLLINMGQLAEGTQALEALLAKAPTDSRRVLLAQAYVKNRQAAKAEAVIAPAVENAPGDVELRMFYARLLRDQRKLPAAAQQFAGVVRGKPDFAEAWSELASVLVITEQYPQALDALDHVTALGAETAGHMFFRALCLDRLKQRPQAVESYRKFLGATQGKFPDQEFQAKQRVRILENEMRKK